MKQNKEQEALMVQLEQEASKDKIPKEHIDFINKQEENVRIDRYGRRYVINSLGYVIYL